MQGLWGLARYESAPCACMASLSQQQQGGAEVKPLSDVVQATSLHGDGVLPQGAIQAGHMLHGLVQSGKGGEVLLSPAQRAAHVLVKGLPGRTCNKRKGVCKTDYCATHDAACESAGLWPTTSICTRLSICAEHVALSVTVLLMHCYLRLHFSVSSAHAAICTKCLLSGRIFNLFNLLPLALQSKQQQHHAVSSFDQHFT